ncbi:vacuolar protein sorting-associated protein 9A-like [Neltuma alba]|uniref:vacuolar protein sorting-associated protein 9A-like n=1 Tax=Neltuma alba TaxID=207710 RepID=UPI0010A2FBC4|nr:vacuolar protein sorting-associated protein 9A-like [Prosopis alba]
MDASTSSQSLSFFDFLDRMRNPASIGLVRSIKSFIVSFSFYPPNPENDGKRVQEFYLTMEAAIREHPLWTGATEEEIDCAMEALEKYVMTKLFSRTFAVSPEDTKIDHEISEKICLVQTFLKPEHLDIPAILRNEASWLLAEKELQKINTFKAPREKLSSIMNCCRVINNLLLNASMTENHVPAGADEFLPVLIYVTIKANPPQLQSNLKFIQLYRRQAKLISEPEYYFTNLVSAKSFIIDLNATSLSMDEIEFEENMQVAKSTTKVTDGACPVIQTNQTNQHGQTGCSPSKEIHGSPVTATPLQVSEYPYLEAKSDEMTLKDVDRLLTIYKEVVAKYTTLCRLINNLPTSDKEPMLRRLESQGAGVMLEREPISENKTTKEASQAKEEK